MKIWSEEEIKHFESLRTKKEKLPILTQFCKDHNIQKKDGNYIFTVNMKKYLVSDTLFKADRFIVIHAKYDRIIRIWHELFFKPLKKVSK